MKTKAKLDDVIEKASVLDYEEQEILLDVLKHRHVELRRDMILANAKKTVKQYKEGTAKRGTSKDLRSDLDNEACSV